MDDAYLARKESSFNVPPYLSVTRAGDREVVHIGCTPIANHFVSDVTSRRQVMVQLAEAGRLKAVQIADCFGVDSGGFEFLEFFLPYKGFFEFRDKAVFRALGFQP